MMPHWTNTSSMASMESPLHAFVKQEQDIPLVSTKIGVRILGGLALVTTERLFRNKEAKSIEATITFPVPVQATLLGLKAVIDGRELSATAQRRATARQTYEEAIDCGHSAVLHEEALPGIHMLSVGHIAAGKEIAVTNVWAAALSEIDGEVSLRIPTTVGDIYGRSPLADSDDLVHAPVIHEASLEVTCDSGDIHLKGSKLEDGKASLHLDAPIDLQITNWSPRDLKGQSADGRSVELKVAPAPKGDWAIAAEVLADISGSMDSFYSRLGSFGEASGSKFDAMVSGLSQAAQQLKKKDHFRLWQFDTHAELLGSGHGREAFSSALARISRPCGGTDIQGALVQATQDSELTDVILITDGKSYALDVHSCLQTGKRFTVVLIGEDSLDANVGYLASQTGGQIFVTGASSVASAIRAAIASLRSPRTAGAGVEQAKTPKTMKACRSGMLVEAHWSGKAKAAKSDEDARAIGAFAAALAIPSLEEDAAASLAEAHGIVCHLTSLVLVDEAGEQQEGLPAQRKVPLSTPAVANAAGATCGATFAAMGLDGASRGVASLACSGGHLAESAGVWTAGDFAWGGPSVGGHRRSALGSGVPEMQPDLSKLLRTSGSSFDASRSLKLAQISIDWSSDPEGLRRGDFSNLSPWVRSALVAASKLEAVKDLAQELGTTGETLVLALLARADGSRSALRLARSILGKTEETKLSAVCRVLGL